MGGESQAIAHQFGDMATQVFARSPLYRRLCRATALDLDVAGRLLLAPRSQRLPTLLLAAVHDVLLAGSEDLLADWYPSIPGARPGLDRHARPVGRGSDDPWPHFRRLALGDLGVVDRLATRATQTNEVGRCAAILPVLTTLAQTTDIGLVEVGASAGLNLRLDSYGYRYVPAGEEGAPASASLRVGATVMVECELRGPEVPPVPIGHLPIVTAVGLDQSPLVVGAASDARWLQACQWPEDTERMLRLRAAIDAARTAPPVVESGDAVDDLAQHVVAVPGHAHPVVVATWVLSYLSVARQQAFLAELDALSAMRDLTLVFAEQPERVPGIPIPARPDGHRDGRATALVRIDWTDGVRHATRVADMHPHGRWLEWFAA